ncbi:MAG: hypothetical protein LBG60_06690, partial [Bifidobacteriaceae bacterium]|nr:hypothetical protein [Bifidobacteriaceae bacterium]
MKTKRSAIMAGAAAIALILTACSSGDEGGDGGDGGDGGGEVAKDAFAGEASGTLDAWGFENADDVGQSRLDYVEGLLTEVEVQLDPTAFDSQKF